MEKQNLCCNINEIERIISTIEEEIDNCRQSGKIAISTKLRICPEVEGPNLFISRLEKIIDILKLPNISFIDITVFLFSNPNLLICDFPWITDTINFLFSCDGPKYIKPQKETIHDFELEEHINSKEFKKCILQEFSNIVTNKTNYTLEMLASIQLRYPDISDFSSMLKKASENNSLKETPGISYTKKYKN